MSDISYTAPNDRAAESSNPLAGGTISIEGRGYRLHYQCVYSVLCSTASEPVAPPLYMVPLPSYVGYRTLPFDSLKSRKMFVTGLWLSALQIMSHNFMKHAFYL